MIIQNIGECVKSPGIAFLLSESSVESELKSILPNSRLELSFEYFPNSAELLLLYSSFEYVEDLSNWYLRIIGVEEQRLKLLSDHEIPCLWEKLKAWLREANDLLYQELLKWQCLGLTIKGESNQLVFNEQSAYRPTPRPRRRN